MLEKNWLKIGVNSSILHSNPSSKLLYSYYPNFKPTENPLRSNYQPNSVDLYLKNLAKNNPLNKENKSYTGLLTTATKKRLQENIDKIVFGSITHKIFNPYLKEEKKHRLAFLTLTISDEKILPYKDCYKKLLSPFLDWLTRTNGTSTYLWKAELQKRGQLHYHLITPDWIDYQIIREKWNNIQMKAGIDLSKYNFNPNSTDIEVISEIKGITTYIAKEIMKDCQNQLPLGIKLWGCSKNLTDYPTLTLRFQEEKICKYLNKSNSIEKEHCIIVRLRYSTIKKILPKEELFKFNEYIKNLRKIVYPNNEKLLLQTKNIFNPF